MYRDPTAAVDGFLAALEAALRGRPVSVHGDLAAPGAAVPPHVKPASVVVPLFVDAEGPGVLFLRRTEGAVPHSGQIAFPGGRREAGEDELACALREAHEEVGLAAEHLEVVGPLDRYATVTDYLISPFVARVRSWPIRWRWRRSSRCRWRDSSRRGRSRPRPARRRRARGW